jgi:hypothetical protein
MRDRIEVLLLLENISSLFLTSNVVPGRLTTISQTTITTFVKNQSAAISKTSQEAV